MEELAREYLLKIPLWTKKKNTLDQVREFLQELGDPERQLHIIHVAGTNGKGSVCADLTAILKEAGYRVGTFVSPHLTDIRERFLIDGELVGEPDFEACFRKVLAVVKRMTGKGYCHPTFFEFVFLMAMVLFEEKKTDYVILETGLGGRLDTTNVVRHPLACVITSISLDHTQYLGDTIAEIAGEKAGIIKPGVPVIYDDNQPEASAVIAAWAQAIGAAAYPVSEKQVDELTWQTAFAAPYQAMNAALAVETLKVLAVAGTDGEVCRRGLAKVRWHGRMEQAAEDIWLDGAHNPGGIRAFIRAVKEQLGADAQTEAGMSAGAAAQTGEEIFAGAAARIGAEIPTGTSARQGIQILFAAVSDKDYHDMIHMLCTELPLKHVTVAHLGSSRAADEKLLAQQFLDAGCPSVEQYPTTGEALKAAVSHREEYERLYVVGSLYLIGEIKELLNEGKGSQEEGIC